MDLSRLRHILAVARTRSFSRAAEEVNITQPALSRSIAAFEREHGVRLFDRGRGGVSPTPAGNLVIEQARNLLSGAADLERSLQLYTRGEAGRVAIGLGPLIASVLLSDLTSALLAARPGLEIQTSVGLADTLVPLLADDTIELIIANDRHMLPSTGLVREVVGTVSLSIFVRGGHPLAGRTGLSLDDIAAFPVATVTEPGAGGLPVTRGGALVCDNFHILREVVQRTDCVWYSSSRFVAQELLEGRLAALDLVARPETRQEICAVWREGRTRSPAALAVVEECREILAASDDLSRGTRA